MSVLITGGAGFIGSNYVIQQLERDPHSNVIVLDQLTYAGSLDNLAPVMNQIEFVTGNISDVPLVKRLFEDHDIRQVVHFAAESHVDNSILDPGIFVHTNVVGTYVLLEAARQAWMAGPFKPKQGYDTARFLHVSTDEVFGSLSESGLFSEASSYAPNSPYSASKAGSDMLVRSYFHTFGLNVVTTNCSNNYGPRQHREKLIPTIIRTALASQAIPIYGDGQNIRDWLYVADHCDAIYTVLHHGKAGEIYLVGSRNEWTNLRIAHTICDILDRETPLKNGKSYRDLIAFVADRPGHDLRYAIDPTKLETELNWESKTPFNVGLNDTVKWYLNQ